MIALPAGAAAANCWFSVTVLLPASTAATAVPAARPVPVAAMPTLTPATEAKLRAVVPAVAAALVESVTPVPGSEFRTVRTAVSSELKAGGVPSVGIWNASRLAAVGGGGNCR